MFFSRTIGCDVIQHIKKFGTLKEHLYLCTNLNIKIEQ